MTLSVSDDNLTNIVNILSEGWDTSNVAKPVVKRVMDTASPMTKDLQQADFILVYPVNYTEEYIDLGAYNTKNVTRISIDIRTIRGIDRLRDLHKECRRCLWEKRINPVDDSNVRFPFHYIVPLSGNDLSDKMKPLYRFVYDVELREMVLKVTT